MNGHPSEDFPDPDCYILSSKMNAKLWEDERDACQEGDCMTGCVFGLISRIVFPLSALCAIVTSAVASPIEIACGVSGCAGGSVVGAAGTLACCNENCMSTAAGCCAFGGACCLGGCLTAEIIACNALMLPLDIVFPECLGMVGFHEWMSRRAVARSEHREKQKFGFQ